MAVVVSFFACVYQSPENGSTSAAPAARSSSLDEVRLAQVEVDGAVVNGRVGALALDDAEHRARVCLDDEHRVDAGRAERDARGRIVAARPREARGRAAQLGQLGGALERLVSERRAIVVVDRRLVGGGEHVPVEHARVRVIEDRRLDPPSEQRVRLAHEVLVERVVGGDEHREAVALPAGASPLLPQAGDGARKAHRDHAVEQADVDAELERVRRGHSEQLAGGEPPLDVAPLRGRVAGAVRREPVLVLAAEPVEGEAMDELRRPAALREAQRAKTALDELREQAGTLTERAGAEVELLVGHRRVPEHDRSLGPRRRIAGDDRRLQPRQRRGQLARVRDRRGGEQELRVGAVDGREPPQASQHVRRHASRTRRGTRAPRRR